MTNRPKDNTEINVLTNKTANHGLPDGTGKLRENTKSLLEQWGCINCHS
jgi:hypothetical protein